MFRTACRIAGRSPGTALLLVVALAIGALGGQSGMNSSNGSESTLHDRGEYLVHHVAMCVQCHSPRPAGGELSEQALLQGGRILVASPYREFPWALRAPRLAGIPGWNPDDLTTLLRTGKRRDGSSPRPPMPPFRLNEEDARAVVAYLSSLTP
jgi:mono/diheme cytochrome c family protein